MTSLGVSFPCKIYPGAINNDDTVCSIAHLLSDINNIIGFTYSLLLFDPFSSTVRPYPSNERRALFHLYVTGTVGFP